MNPVNLYCIRTKKHWWSKKEVWRERLPDDDNLLMDGRFISMQSLWVMIHDSVTLMVKRETIPGNLLFWGNPIDSLRFRLIFRKAYKTFLPTTKLSLFDNI